MGKDVLPCGWQLRRGEEQPCFCILELLSSSRVQIRGDVLENIRAGERVGKVIVKPPREIKCRSVPVLGSSSPWEERFISRSTLLYLKKKKIKTTKTPVPLCACVSSLENL